MKYIIKAKYIYTAVLLGFLIALIPACKEEDVLDNSLRILSLTIDGDEVESGALNISKDLSMEIIFSHSLNPTQLESALSIVDASGNPVGYSSTYSNTNSTVTLTPELDFEQSYTLRLNPGVYGNAGEAFTQNFSLDFTTSVLALSLSASQSNLGEEGQQVIITAALTGTLAQDVNLDFSFGGLATLDSDFSASATSISIPAGQLSGSITLTSNQDGAIEGTESIQIGVSQVNVPGLSVDPISVDLLDDDIDSNGDGTTDRGFIINEVLYDPPSDNSGTPEVEGDANGDGVRSASADEFIEFVNDTDQPVDLSGFTLFDATALSSGNPRHTFPAGTIVPAQGVYVLFGGGSPSGDFGNADVAVSTSGNMNLSNADDVITILDGSGNVFLTFDTQGEGAGLDFGNNQSVTRSPDINGDFDLHLNVNALLEYSPGKLADGSEFGSNAPTLIINEVHYDPASDISGDANGDGVRNAAEDEFIEFVNVSDEALDISGYTVFDTDALGAGMARHTFPDNTVIPAGGVLVLFSGGTPTGSFGGAIVQTTNGFENRLNLNNGGDAITVRDAMGNDFLTFDSATDGSGISFGSNQSVTRSPDLVGGFVLHTTANPALIFSPGTRRDGSTF